MKKEIKNLFVFIIGVLLLSSCLTKSESGKIDSSIIDAKNPAEFKFQENEYDFGAIAEGEIISHTFEFENSGKSPLIIEQVKAGCGCTTPKGWPKEPISPGEKGKIEVEFNSKGKRGKQKKIISIVANTKPSTRTELFLIGEVIAADE